VAGKRQSGTCVAAVVGVLDSGHQGENIGFQESDPAVERAVEVIARLVDQDFLEYRSIRIEYFSRRGARVTLIA